MEIENQSLLYGYGEWLGGLRSERKKKTERKKMRETVRERNETGTSQDVQSSYSVEYLNTLWISLWSCQGHLEHII